MRALALISLLAIHTVTSSPTPDLEKLAEHAAHKLDEVKHHLKEKAVEHLHKIVEGLDLEKLKKLDVLHLLKPKHHVHHEFAYGLLDHHVPHHHHEKHHLEHIHHEKHLDHIHHEKHHLDHIHHEKHHLDHLHHHHKEPLFIDPHQVERVKYYFEQEHHKE